MTKKVKSFVTSFLILVLMFTSNFSFVNANTSTNNSEDYILVKKIYAHNLSEDELTRIIEDFQLLSSCGIPQNDIKNITKKDGLFIYEITTTEIPKKASVSVEKLPNNDIHYTFKEGTLCNEVIYTNKGEVLLDGNKVTVETEASDQRNATLANKSWKSTYKKFKPYKNLKSSSYSSFLASGKQNIRLGKAIDKITAHALLAALGSINFWAGLTCNGISAAADVRDTIKSANPKTKVIGCKYSTYVHGSSDYKYILKHYPNESCTGKKYKKKKIYEHFIVY